MIPAELFSTQRLVIREMSLADADPFFDVMGNPNVMNPIPLAAMNRAESDRTLEMILSKSGKFASIKIWAVLEKSSNIFIGFGGLIASKEGEPELAYRLREKYWGQSFGSELAEGIIQYCINDFKQSGRSDNLRIVANVNINNSRSIGILDKYMKPVGEFYNEMDGGMDRRYELLVEN